MPLQLVILGITGNAQDILDIVDAINSLERKWELIGFLDDAHRRGSRHHGIEVLGGLREASKLAGVSFINSIGSERSFRKRADVVAMASVSPERFATLIHPTASVSPRARIGAGTCVNSFARVAGGSTIGAHVWLGTGCTLEYDTTLGDYAIVGPGAVVSGGAQIGASAYIGARAALRTRVRVGEKAQVGLGAVVIGDVAPGTTVVGNPARTLVRSQASNHLAETPKPRTVPPETPPPRGDG